VAFNTSEVMSQTFNVGILVRTLHVIMPSHVFTIDLDNSNILFKNTSAGIFTNNLWGQFSEALINGISKYEFAPYGATVEVFKQSSGGDAVDPMDMRFNLDLSLMDTVFVNPMIVLKRDFGLRGVLVSKTLGPRPDEVYAIGRPEIMKSTMYSNFACNNAEKCMLDIPLKFDILKRDTYNSRGTTYYDELKKFLLPVVGDLLTSVEMEPFATRYLRAMSELIGPRIPRTVITIPKTLAMWFLRDGAVYHLNRRGVGVEDINSGKCIPADIIPCPSCQWATSERMCQPCSVASKSVAWTIQCLGCPTALSRRLLTTGTVTVTVTIGNSSEAELVRLFSGSVRDNSIVTVESSNPTDTLRLMSSEISKHPGWVVISQPQVVYVHGTVVETVSSDLSPWAVLGILAGCLLFVVCAVFAYLQSRKPPTPVADQKEPLLPPVPKPLAAPTSRLFQIKIDRPRSAQKHI
jgi:hypothetical protein